jgi:hypothetical protein
MEQIKLNDWAPGRHAAASILWGTPPIFLFVPSSMAISSSVEFRGSKFFTSRRKRNHACKNIYMKNAGPRDLTALIGGTETPLLLKDCTFHGMRKR